VSRQEANRSSQAAKATMAQSLKEIGKKTEVAQGGHINSIASFTSKKY